MIRFVVLLLALALPWEARAETVRVRSGEHAGFSRLVLYFDGGLGWSLGRVDGGYEFRPPRTDIDWDLSRAFDRIPKDRIKALTDRGDGRLFLAVDCACHADAFVLRDGQVVLDIKDGSPPLAGSPFEARLAPAVGVSEGDPPRRAMQGRLAEFHLDPALPSPPVVGDRGGLPLMIFDQGNRVGRAATGSSNIRADDASGSDALVSLEGGLEAGVEPDISSRVRETEAALIAQIARAAAQGLIEADLSGLENDIQAATHPLVPPAAETETPQSLPAPKPPIAPRGHVSVETGVDRAQPDTPTEPGSTDDGLTCIAPDLFDVGNWGDPPVPGADIGAYRSKILGEFDQANGEAVTDLARYYVFLAFGAEAEALIRSYPANVIRPDLIVAMAEIVDHGHAEIAATLVDQMACDGATALWAVLAQPNLARGQSINAEGATLAFAGLPGHLRGHLGPGLAEKFLMIDDVTAAERIRNAIARSGEASGPALDLLTARIDLSAGNTARASEALERVVDQESESLVPALLERIEMALARGEAVAADQISLLQSVAFEHRGSPVEARLVDAELRARAVSGDFEMAFHRLQEAEADGLLTDDRALAVSAEIFASLARDGADKTFLRLAIPRRERAARLPAPQRQAIAKRFLDLGFPGPARDVLWGTGSVPDKADRLLFARAALMEDRPTVAIGYLAGLNDAKAERLRAQVLERAGDFAGAIRAFDKAGAPDLGSRAAWRGGEWDTLAARDAGVLTIAAEMMTAGQPRDRRGPNPGLGADIAEDADSPDPAAPAPKTPFALARALIEESRGSRDALDLLFDAVGPVPLVPGS